MTSPNIGSTQTIVHFLTQPTAGVFVESKRVFELEISQASADHFTLLMTELKNRMEAIQATEPPTAASLQQAQDILQALDNWSQMIYVDEQGDQQHPLAYFIPAQFDGSGNIVAGTGILTADPEYNSEPNISTTMTRYMAESIDQIVRSIRSAGFDCIHGGININELRTAFVAALKDNPEIYDILPTLERGISAAEQALVAEDAFSQSESLQQLLMVDYISRGNELLFNEMSNLKGAIDINQSILSYLNSLQDLMNQKDPQHFIMQLQFLAGATSEDETSWQQFEKETFNQELGTESKLPGASEEDIEEYISGILGTDIETGEAFPEDPTGTLGGAFVERQTFLENGTFILNASLTTIIENLEAYKVDLEDAAGTSGTPLAEQLDKIINDFNTHPDIVTWIQDYESGQEGEFQRHLNDAVVASQALNDTEREELRRVMFVYEEFYKSATAMLSRMTQIIERMAAAISR